MGKLMSGPLSTSAPPISTRSPSAISSQASAGGLTLFDSLDGQTTDPSGPGVALVSHSRVRARRLGETIRATFGQRGFGSSASAALTSCLVNKLKARLPTDGSILFKMTWKEKATPSGRSVSLLRASGHRTSDSDYGSWPSPAAQEPGGTVEQVYIRKVQARENGARLGLTLGTHLSHAVQLASWPTPKAEDSESTGAQRGQPDTLTSASILTAWATPAARDYKSESSSAAFNESRWDHRRGKPLSAEATLAPWATPTIPNGGRKPKGGTMSTTGQTPEGKKRQVDNDYLANQVIAPWATPTASEKIRSEEFQQGRTPTARETLGPISNGSPAETAKRGQLNAAFSRWLMGFPAAWDISAIKAHRSIKRHKVNIRPSEIPTRRPKRA